MDKSDILPDVRTHTSTRIVLFPLLYRSSEAQRVIKGYGKISVIAVEHIFVNYYALNSKRSSFRVTSKFLYILRLCVCVCVCV